MLYLCSGTTRKRLVLSCSRFYSSIELFKLARDAARNNTPLWLEHEANVYQPIHTDAELRFACSMLEGDIEANQPDADREQNARDVADYAHTVDFEASLKRKSRDRPNGSVKKKLCSKLEELPNAEMNPINSK
jgi:hypothetical protein